MHDSNLSDMMQSKLLLSDSIISSAQKNIFQLHPSLLKQQICQNFHFNDTDLLFVGFLGSLPIPLEKSLQEIS